MAEKKLKEMPKLTGIVPRYYDREVIYGMVCVINALSGAMNFLNKKVIALEEKLEAKSNG